MNLFQFFIKLDKNFYNEKQNLFLDGRSGDDLGFM